MKKLGFGCMRFPLFDAEDPTSIDKEQVKKMFDMFLNRGFIYVDTAYPYHSGESEKAVKECLTDRYDRDSFKLATKLPTFNLTCEEDCPKYFNEQLEKTGAGYFDFYLIHCLNERLYKVAKECKAFEYVSRMKEEGKIKEMGFSFHDSPELLDEILNDHPEVDFVQLQINFLDWEDDNVQSKGCYEVARKHGKEIVIMEPIKGGKLVDIDQKVKDKLAEVDPNATVPALALRFAASLPGVRMVLSGMSSLEQLDENTVTLDDFTPMSEKEVETMLEAAKMIREATAIACTGCSYCTDGCPMHIAIPKYFDLYNKRCRDLSKGKSADYDKLTEEFGPASTCIGCGQCESMCPQHLPIIETLVKVADSFEN